jgi:lysophospholipase
VGPLGPGSTAIALRAADGVALRAATRGPEGAPRGLILLLPGRAEVLEKYAPVADLLAARGFALAGLDWRGQGGSARALANPRKGHVDAFAHYARDLRALLDATAAAPGPRVMLAHSMGGLVGLRALCGPAPVAAAAAFSAPMWGLAQGAATAWLGRGLSRAARGLGLGARYAPGGGDTPYVLSGFAGNALTSCPEGFAHAEAVARARPDLSLGGPTWGWVRAAYDEMAACARLRLRVPALIVAGSEDRVVDLRPMRARAARGEARLALLAGARHEPLFETPAVRARLWAELDAFLDAAAPQVTSTTRPPVRR